MLRATAKCDEDVERPVKSAACLMVAPITVSSAGSATSRSIFSTFNNGRWKSHADLWQQLQQLLLRPAINTTDWTNRVKRKPGWRMLAVFSWQTLRLFVSLFVTMSVCMSGTAIRPTRPPLSLLWEGPEPLTCLRLSKVMELKER